MDNREIALELLKMYLERTDERVTLDDLLEAYMKIVEVLEGKKEETEEKEKDSDLLFDFKEPISLSDKD